MIVTPHFVLVSLLALATTGNWADAVVAQGVVTGRVNYFNNSPVGANEVEVRVTCLNGNNQVVELGFRNTSALNPMAGTNYSVPVSAAQCATCSNTTKVSVTFKQLTSGAKYQYTTPYTGSDLANVTTRLALVKVSYNKPLQGTGPDVVPVTAPPEPSPVVDLIIPDAMNPTPSPPFGVYAPITTYTLQASPRVKLFPRRRGLFGLRR